MKTALIAILVLVWLAIGIFKLRNSELEERIAMIYGDGAHRLAIVLSTVAIMVWPAKEWVSYKIASICEKLGWY